ncbi:hypothetical protein Esti_003361 [Eimeria stiedai]
MSQHLLEVGPAMTLQQQQEEAGSAQCRPHLSCTYTREPQAYTRRKRAFSQTDLQAHHTRTDAQQHCLNTRCRLQQQQRQQQQPQQLLLQRTLDLTSFYQPIDPQQQQQQEQQQRSSTPAAAWRMGASKAIRAVDSLASRGCLHTLLRSSDFQRAPGDPSVAPSAWGPWGPLSISRRFAARTRRMREQQQQQQQQQQPAVYTSDATTPYNPHQQQQQQQQYGIGSQLLFAVASGAGVFLGFSLLSRLFGWGPRFATVHVDAHGRPVDPLTGAPLQRPPF